MSMKSLILTLTAILGLPLVACSNAPYVQFYGEVIANVDDLPDRYEDVIQITELLSYDASMPVVCK